MEGDLIFLKVAAVRELRLRHVLLLATMMTPSLMSDKSSKESRLGDTDLDRSPGKITGFDSRPTTRKSASSKQ